MARATHSEAGQATDFSSADYWKNRYAIGGKSGAGSYGRLAEYKAGYINGLVDRKGIASVIEYGSGDGNQASLFNFAHYTGADLSPDAVAACNARFTNRSGWKFELTTSSSSVKHDLSMSLDVIYHLIEDEVFDRYMTTLFGSASRFVLIYASDHDEQVSAAHVRHRNFSSWIAANQSSWSLLEAPQHPFPFVKGSNPRTTSFASFKLFGAP